MIGFSQYDPRWGRRMLGSSRLTLKRGGCLLCAVCSALNDLGATTMDPGALNEWLRLGGGYIYENLLVWSALEALDVRATLIECWTAPAPMARISGALVAGKAVVAHVDFDPGGPVSQHWVRLLGPLGDDWAIMDPWNDPGHEECLLLGRYALQGWDAARAIFEVAVLERVEG